jgi:hypothetical protein
MIYLFFNSEHKRDDDFFVSAKERDAIVEAINSGKKILYLPRIDTHLSLIYSGNFEPVDSPISKLENSREWFQKRFSVLSEKIKDFEECGRDAERERKNLAELSEKSKKLYGDNFILTN